MNTTARERQKMGDDMQKWSKVGTETITVPGGTFICQHWKKKDGKGDVWVNDKITPFGMVKEVSAGYKPGPPEGDYRCQGPHHRSRNPKFDPNNIQQMMMNQTSRERQ